MTTDNERPERRARGAYERVGKPLFDWMVALLLAIATLPFLLLLMTIVGVIFRGWPVVKHARVGRGGVVFDLYQLRTNYAITSDLHGRPRQLAHFLRAWSLDELPQLWNVILGHMSLVGPRPLTEETVSRLEGWQQKRYDVKPGITGLWQIQARGDGRDLLDNIHYDVQYIDQLSFLTDLRILGATPAAVVFHRQGKPDTRPNRKRLRDRVGHIRLIATDLTLWAVAIPLAVWVRFDFNWSGVSATDLLRSIVPAVVLQSLWGLSAGLYRGRWRLGSFEETAWVGSGAATVTILLLATATIFSGSLVSRGALVGAGSFQLLGALTARYVARSIYTSQERSAHQRHRRLLVFGAGQAGLEAVRALWMDASSDLEPVAFLDDDVTKHGSRLLGLPVVGGRDDIAATVRRYAADSLVVAMPSAPHAALDDLESAGRTLGLSVQVMPPLVASLSDLLVEHARRAPVPTSTYQPTEPARRPGGARTAGDREFDLAIIGLGYVGLPVAVHASRLGIRVLGLDIAQDRVAGLNAGSSYIEDVPDESLAEAITAGFRATTDSSTLANADAITISVPTPLRDGLPDLGAVISASEAIGNYLQPGQVVILESTTYPGTTEEVVQPILEERSGLKAGTDFYLAYSPERIDPGNEQWGIHNTPKLVGGINLASTEAAATLYQKFSPVVTMSGTREAEMAKLLENTYRHVNIALVNELAIFSRQLGVDIWETIRGAATKPFGFQAFYPGPGVGGHCIPIDPNYLSFRVRELGQQFRFIELAQEINEFMPQYVANRAVEELIASGRSPNDARVLVLGVAYKPGVSDTRETPATDLIRSLVSEGMEVAFSDPFVTTFSVDDQAITAELEPIENAASYDLVIIHTAHAELDIATIANVARLTLDTWGVAPPGLAAGL